MKRIQRLDPAAVLLALRGGAASGEHPAGPHRPGEPAKGTAVHPFHPAARRESFAQEDYTGEDENIAAVYRRTTAM